MVTVCYGSMELYCTFRITGQGVYFSGEVKIVKIATEGKPIARSLRGAMYENALSH